MTEIIKTVTPVAKDVHGWYDIAKDFILPLIIAGLAALAAYYIFYRETQRDRKKDIHQQAQRNKDKLTYFTALLSNAIKTSNDQREFVLEFIKEIVKDDVHVPLLTYMPIKDLERLVNMDIEPYLLAFTDYYAQDRKASIKQFKTIMVNVDFLYHMFKSIFEQLQKAQQFDYERKTKYQELFYKAYNLSGEILLQLHSEKEWIERLNALFDNFTKHHSDNYDVAFYYEYFFTPYNDFFTEYMTAVASPSFEITEAAVATRDGKQLFKHIKVENQQLAGDFSKDAERIIESISELKRLTEQLVTDF